MIKENTKAPIFKLPSTNKKEYSLKDSIGNYVIIYFYPKDDTPGCTIETNDFNKLLPKFKKLNTFLIDKKGKIIKIWNNVKVKDHAKEVLETLQNIVKK